MAVLASIWLVGLAVNRLAVLRVGRRAMVDHVSVATTVHIVVLIRRALVCILLCLLVGDDLFKETNDRDG